jgi:acyl-coenzyme A synthetase/AMP-(fatty) acid ligase
MQIPHPAMIGLLFGEHYLIYYPAYRMHLNAVYDYAVSDWNYYLKYSCFASTGEASNVDEYLWLMGRARYKPIIEYCGGTEIGGGFVTGSLQQAQSLAAFSTPAMCCNLFILGEDGHPIVSTIHSNLILNNYPCSMS